MVKKCIVQDCGECGDRGLFRIPVDPLRRSQWIQVLGLVNQKLPKDSRVCFRHFDANQIKHTKNAVSLIKDAVPTIGCQTLVAPWFSPPEDMEIQQSNEDEEKCDAQCQTNLDLNELDIQEEINKIIKKLSQSQRSLFPKNPHIMHK